jgi:YHS domain-containing protein
MSDRRDRIGEERMAHDEPAGGVSLDPVCGKPVVEDDAESAEYKHKTYFFCSERCRNRFARHAERLRMNDLAKLGVLFGGGKKVRWGVA